MDALRKEEVYTIDDIYALPDGKHAELIDGKIYDVAPPSWQHQKISGYLYNEFIIILIIITENVKFWQRHLLCF